MIALSRWALLAIALCGSASAGAATINAASCSANAVQTALNSASQGDTVVIPAGTCRWTTGVSWTAPADVTVKGAGTSATGGGDQTVIIDDYATNAALWRIRVPSSGVFRLTGLTIQSGSGAIKDPGTLRFDGPGIIRVDHIHLNTTSTANYQALVIGSGVFGVLDQSILYLKNVNSLRIQNGRFGANDWMGNYEWTLPTNFGGSDFFFVEDNIIRGSPEDHAARVYDCYTAGKVVVRFNTLQGSTAGEDHATGHSPDDRGCRAKEIYGNSLQRNTGQTISNFCLIDIGSGGALIWGNRATSNAVTNVIRFNVTRKNNATYSQSPAPSNWGYCGTEFNGSGSTWDGNQNAVTGYPCIDQPGSGPGQLLTGGSPNKINSVTGTQVWPNQVREPVYIWNIDAQPYDGGTFYNNASGNRVQANRDYYAQASGIQTSSTSPFNATSGTGWGTLANRPTTCTTGVGYWATDQGSWNKSASNPYGVQQNGADGVLYKCTAPNTWTLYYTPYTYPHPLTQTGGQSALAAPSNLRVSP